MDINNISLPSNRKFGFFFAVLFSLSGLYLFVFDSLNNWSLLFAQTFFVISLILVGISLAKPDLLKGPNLYWLKFGLLLGEVARPVILGLIYFGVFAPIGICMRAFGRDELELKKTEKASYWKERVSDLKEHSSFHQQF